ncbi:MAG: glycine oxidase ThiO [Aquificae bacterium]|nr:glycine oxidase ThiO [Aquificota bacterium]
MNILIIGSGVIGLSTAFELALAGHRVRVITRNYEEGTSWVAGGMLAPYSEGLEGDLLEFSRESLSLYSDFIDRLSDVARLSIYFNRNGILRLAVDQEELSLIEKKLSLYARLGISFQKLEVEELFKREPLLSKTLMGGVLFEEEGNVDAEKLMDALLFACENLKIKILIDDITEVELKDGRVESVKGYRETYRADFYVFATGSWSRQLLKLPVFPVKGQILKVKGLELDKVYYSKLAYIIPKENHILIGATSEDAGFDRRPTLGGVKSLAEGSIKVIPSMEGAEFLSVKVGFRPATPDEKPILKLGENFAYLVGHYRNGILWAPISAKLILDFVERGVVSPYFDKFSDGRFKT